MEQFILWIRTRLISRTGFIAQCRSRAWLSHKHSPQLRDGGERAKVWHRLTMGFFQKTRDRLIEKTAPAVLNETVFRDYGEITSLEIDSVDKTIHFEALLRGEKEPIRVEILRYEIVQRDGR